MLLFHCSQAAVEGLTTRRKGQPESWVTSESLPEAETPIWAWYLHQVTIDRQRVWVAMEQQSRFAVVLWGFKKGDGGGLLHAFYERLINHLLDMVTGLELLNERRAEQLVPHLLAQLSPFHFVPGTDRSVQSHINDVVQACRLAVSQQGCLPNNQEQAANFDLFLNQTPRSVRGGPVIFPDEQWLCLQLAQLAGHHRITGAAVLAAFKAARKAYWEQATNQ